MVRRQHPHLAQALLHLLSPYPDGLSPKACWQALTQRPAYRAVPYNTIMSALRLLCDRGHVIDVARGRYALSSAFRAAYAPLDTTSAPGRSTP